MRLKSHQEQLHTADGHRIPGENFTVTTQHSGAGSFNLYNLKIFDSSQIFVKV